MGSIAFEEMKATGCTNLIIAGVTNDVCTVFPTLTALAAGHQVQVVADAGGSPAKIADDIAIRRMDKAGATITSTNQLRVSTTHPTPHTPPQHFSRPGGRNAVRYFQHR